MNLSASETRVLGCLLEKQRTTPDMYPLTLNSLRLACNQSTNRDPVVEYDDAIVRDALHRLERRGLTRLASGRGARAEVSAICCAEALPMDDGEQAVMCVLMLRGPQTPGELKQRTERMHPFADLDDVHETLERLIDRELVARLDRRPGQKEERYTQLLEDPDWRRHRHEPTERRSGHASASGPDAGDPAGSRSAGRLSASRRLRAALTPRERVDLVGARAGQSSASERRLTASRATAAHRRRRAHEHDRSDPRSPRRPRTRRPASASRSRSRPGWCRSSPRACCRSCPATSRP